MGSRKPQPGIPHGPSTGDKTPNRGRCPICGAPWERAFRPFCSRRCADVDLARWLRGGYAIPGRADVDEDGDDAVVAGAGRSEADPGSASDEG